MFFLPFPLSPLTPSGSEWRGAHLAVAGAEALVSQRAVPAHQRRQGYRLGGPAGLSLWRNRR